MYSKILCHVAWTLACFFYMEPKEFRFLLFFRNANAIATAPDIEIYSLICPFVLCVFLFLFFVVGLMVTFLLLSICWSLAFSLFAFLLVSPLSYLLIAQCLYMTHIDGIFNKFSLCVRSCCIWIFNKKKQPIIMQKEVRATHTQNL